MASLRYGVSVPPSPHREGDDDDTATKSGGIPIKHFPKYRPNNSFSDAFRLSASYAIDGRLSKKPMHPVRGCYPEWLHRIRVWLYVLMDDSGKSATSVILSFLILLHIAVSCFLLIVSTVHAIHDHWGSHFFYSWEVYFIVIFSSEYVIRFWVADVLGKKRSKWVLEPMNLIDLAAILPNYILYFTLLFHDSKSHDHDHSRLLSHEDYVHSHIENNQFTSPPPLAALRALRILRVFKLTRYSSGLRLLTGALSESASAFQVLGWCLMISTFVFGTLFHYFEEWGCPVHGASEEECAETSGWLCCVPPVDPQKVWEKSHGHNSNNSPGSFFGNNMIHNSDDHVIDRYHHTGASGLFGMWFVLVSFTGTGYGDVTPKTQLGGMIGIICMLLGIIVIALPVAVVGQKFQVLYSLNEADVSGACHRAIFPEDDAQGCQIVGLKIQKLEQDVLKRTHLVDEMLNTQRLLLENLQGITLLCGFDSESQVRRKLSSDSKHNSRNRLRNMKTHATWAGVTRSPTMSPQTPRTANRFYNAYMSSSSKEEGGTGGGGGGAFGQPPPND